MNRNYDKNPFYFDPLGLATDESFGRLREAELKHGRISMLAITETIIVPALKRYKPDWIPSDLTDGLFHSFTSLQTTDYIKVIATCGIVETVIWTQKDPKDMPGDYSVGYFAVRDKGLHERELTVELENGRLAMVAILVQCVAEIISGGMSWEQQWKLIVKQWAYDL
jgi:hypothetical protein